MASHRSKAVKLTVVPIVAAAFLAGCGGDDDQETAYCVDANDTVVDNAQCDNETDGGGGNGFFWFFAGGGRSYGRGSRISGAGDRIRASDRAGLARRGGFGSSARSGGVGRGGSGSSGGFGGSSSGG